MAMELNPLFQGIKIIRQSSATDVSVWTYIIIAMIGTIWFVYGRKIRSLPLIIGNSIKIVTSIFVILTIWWYR
ncbi:MAG: SemiSWEET family transporter [Patescibacteria group bacterium]